ncbi:MAG TPA: hypothetical protein VGB66_19225 [Longimicrobium sp.]
MQARKHAVGYRGQRGQGRRPRGRWSRTEQGRANQHRGASKDGIDRPPQRGRLSRAPGRAQGRGDDAIRERAGRHGLSGGGPVEAREPAQL